MKYKKGDKVEVVEFLSSTAAGYGAKVGDIGVVDIVSDIGDGVPYFVKLDAIKTGDNGLWFSEDGIKLVKEDVENKVGELKAGDKVVLTNARADNARYYNLKEGTKGVVRENDGDTCKPILVDFGYYTIWVDAGDLQLDVEIEKNKIETGDIVTIISKKNTTAIYDWNENMKQVGESMKVDGICGVTVENDIFKYHIDDLVLLRKGDSDVVEPHLENQEELDQFGVTKPTVMNSSTIESDGGSSSYYFTKLPNWLLDKIVETGGIEIKDIVQFVYDNDAHAKDILKAQKRIIEQRKGRGKAGLKPLYDYNKIVFFAEDQLNVATHALSELDR